MTVPSGSFSAGSFFAPADRAVSREPLRRKGSVAVSGDHLVVLDACGAERLLHAATRMIRGPPSSPWQTNRVGVSGIRVASRRLELRRAPALKLP